MKDLCAQSCIIFLVVAGLELISIDDCGIDPN